MAALYGGKPSAGVVSPKNWLSGNKNHNKNTAKTAPMACAKMYLGTFFHSNFFCVCKTNGYCWVKVGTRYFAKSINHGHNNESPGNGNPNMWNTSVCYFIHSHSTTTTEYHGKCAYCFGDVLFHFLFVLIFILPWCKTNQKIKFKPRNFPVFVKLETDLKTPHRTTFSCSRSFSSSILRLDDQFCKLTCVLALLLNYFSSITCFFIFLNSYNLQIKSDC